MIPLRARPILASAGIISVLAACGGNNGSFPVEGTLSLKDYSGFMSTGSEDGSECGGVKGYDDITEGARVVVVDSRGRKIALGELRAGTATDGGNACEFDFTVDEVPRGDDNAIYSVEVAGRGSFDFQESEAIGIRLELG